jgi:hypothetical protein
MKLLNVELMLCCFLAVIQLFLLVMQKATIKIVIIPETASNATPPPFRKKKTVRFSLRAGVM